MMGSYFPFYKVNHEPTITNMGMPSNRNAVRCAGVYSAVGLVVL